MRNSENCMKTRITDGRSLTRGQLSEAGRVLYLTDPEIYPTAFGSEDDVAAVFPYLSEEKDGLFAPENILAALEDDRVCGVLVACNGAKWEKGALDRAFSEAGLQAPDGAADAEEKYFAYEAEHETGDYVLCLCVSPEFRNKGIARKLLKSYLADKERVTLECLADNAAALALYRSEGFKDVKEYYGYSAPGTPRVKVIRLAFEKNRHVAVDA